MASRPLSQVHWRITITEEIKKLKRYQHYNNSAIRIHLFHGGQIKYIESKPCQKAEIPGYLFLLPVGLGVLELSAFWCFRLLLI